MKCVKCGGEMEEGALIGAPLGGSPSIVPTKFTKEIKSSILWGKTADIKAEVKVYKCVQCGYLESYAK